METNYEIINVAWHDVEMLTKNILSQLREQKITIDTLAPVIRGGVPLAMLLASNMNGVDIATIHLKRSKKNKINSEFGDPVFKGITNKESITNKNILLLEDVIDTGLTLKESIKHLEKLQPKNIYIATLYNFKKGNTFDNVIAGKNMDNHFWIVFPWESDLG